MTDHSTRHEHLVYMKIYVNISDTTTTGMESRVQNHMTKTVHLGLIPDLWNI